MNVISRFPSSGFLETFVVFSLQSSICALYIAMLKMGLFNGAWDFRKLRRGQYSEALLPINNC